MVILDEDFLVRNAVNYNLDASLPLRLQKRQLLESLGFPGNKGLQSCLSCQKEDVKVLFKNYSSMGFPFLIIVSEKSPHTIIPPLFVVRDKNDITWRDDKGIKREISYSKMVKVISRFGLSTWLEFAAFIWGEETTAGRLAYISPCEQLIELQIGVIPRQLMDNKEFAVYSGTLSYFELSLQSYRDTKVSLQNMGYKKVLAFSVVREISKNLGERYFGAFEKLAKISSLPTLEFGIKSGQTFISVDIDWPSQWKEVL